MTARNAFVGPGAWDFDLSLKKDFTITERFHLRFGAEAYNIFNHANMYFNGFTEDYSNFSTLGPGGTPAPLVVQGKKGGLGNAANNGDHDERRFGQFSLRLLF
jgi:hypothetical protein